MTDFKPYPTYKDSGVEWLGEVPEHWEIRPFYSLLQERRESNQGLKENNLLSLSYGNIVKRDINSLEGLLPASYETYQIVHPTDIVFRLTDLQNDKRSLRSAIVKEKGIITSAYLAAACEKINSHYANYLFRAYDLTKVFYSMGGGLRQSMKFSDMKRLEVLSPPLKEQTQIARFLDHETARMDALIAEQERLIELLKEKRRSLVLSTVNDTSLPEIRIAELVEVIQRPVRQLEGVEYVPLGLFNRDRGLFHREPREKQDMGESDFFWVKEGDLILSGQFAWEGAVAMAQETENKTVVSHRFPILKGKKGILRTEFLYSLLTTKHGDFLLNENSRGAAGRNRPLNLSLLLKEKIRVPSMLLQDEVAQLVNKEQLLIKEIEFSIELVKERRSALISAAVTGKIDVRNWQPEAEQKTA